MEPLFADRLDAGLRLGHALSDYAGGDAMVVGLARGGVEVGYATAQYLRLPLTVLVVRKVGAPRNPELAIGAVSETGVRWLDREIAAATGADERYIQVEVARQVSEAQRRSETYGTAAALEAIRERPAIVVDDGIATGATALVALQSVRELGSREVILATPVASLPAVTSLLRVADSVVALETPEQFGAVGLYYGNFGQVSDEEVLRYVEMSADR